MMQYIARWSSGIRVRWRALTWEEYRRFRESSYLRPMGVIPDIYRAVVLDGPDIEFCPAGVADFVAKHVLNNNPFCGEYKSVKFAIDRARERLTSTYLHAAKAMICHLLHYSMEEMDKWDQDTFFMRLAQAEYIAGKTLEPANPNTTESAEERQKRIKTPMTRAQSMVEKRVLSRGK